MTESSMAKTSKAVPLSDPEYSLCSSLNCFSLNFNYLASCSGSIGGSSLTVH